MKTALFDFTLPESLIASEPAIPRDAANMLVMDHGITDAMVRDLPHYLRAGDVMVFNDTKVLPARLLGKRGEAKIELLLHKKLPDHEARWQCFAKPAKKLNAGDIVEFSADFYGVMVEKTEDGQVIFDFPCGAETLVLMLERYGQMPLPPYIEKLRKADESDSEHYQTVYAKRAGAVAAPTAGLHFTPELLAAIDAIGVQRVFVTLHVGGGTFLPVKADEVEEHVMHSEYAELSEETARIINDAKKNGGRVIAVGTTSLRTLESATGKDGMVQAFGGETAIFITPGYRFKVVDIMMTNFHLPKSTLFMLVCAFCGIDAMKAAYAHAISQRYRFYSYGDASLLYKA